MSVDNDFSDLSASEQTDAPTRKPRQAKLARTNAERSTAATARPRAAFSGTQTKMQIAPEQLDPNYHYHWINDSAGRIEEAQSGGYTFVTRSEISLAPGVIDKNSELGDKVSMIVGKQESGDAMRAYLMRIQLDWYEANQSEQQARCDQVDQAITQGRNVNPAEAKAFYLPKGTRNSLTRK